MVQDNPLVVDHSICALHTEPALEELLLVLEGGISVVILCIFKHMPVVVAFGLHSNIKRMAYVHLCFYLAAVADFNLV